MSSQTAPLKVEVDYAFWPKLFAARNLLMPGVRGESVRGYEFDIMINPQNNSLTVMGCRLRNSEGPAREVVTIVRRIIPREAIEDNAYLKTFKPMLLEMEAEIDGNGT